MTKCNLSIRCRIHLLALCAVIAVLAVGWLMTHSLGDAREHFRLMARHDINGKIATLAIGRDLNYVSRLTRNVMLGSDIDKDTERLRKTIDSMRKGFVALRASAVDAAEAALIAEAERSTLAFAESGLAFVERLAAVPDTERHTHYPAYEKEATPLAEASRRTFNRIVESKDAHFETANTAFGDELDSARTTAMWLAGSITLVLAVLALFITRSIVRPLSAVTAYASRVAAGDHTPLMLRNTCGEVAVLVESLERMVHDLRERVAFARGVLTALPQPCLLVDAEGRATWWNQPFAAIAKCATTAPESGLPVRQVVTSSELLALLQRAQDDGMTREDEMTFADGSLQVVTVAPVLGEDRSLRGLLTSCFDLTALRNQQEQLHRHNAHLAEAADAAGKTERELNTTTGSIGEEVEASLTRAVSQQQRTSEVAVAVEEMNASVLEVARSAAAAAGSAEMARNHADRGADVVMQALDAIEGVSDNATRLGEAMDDLGKQAEGIGRIIAVIGDIADQTNLLALNAAIEAARAGDAGRGFAVVADEVRKLAEKTMTATREVEDFIRAIQTSARHSLATAQSTATEVEKTTQLASGAGEALRSIVGMTAETADQVRAIATAAEQQSAASEQIARSTDEIRGSAADNAEGMTRLREELERLRGQATGLGDIIKSMRTA